MFTKKQLITISPIKLICVIAPLLFASCGGTTNTSSESSVAVSSSVISSSQSSSVVISSSSSSSSVSFGPISSGTRTISAGGQQRTFELHVPRSYSPSNSVPLVLDFHGIFGTGRGQMSQSGYQAVSEREGFIVAYPDGIDNAWNVGPCCTFSRDIDDVAFAKAVVASIQSEANIDASRVYATGMSMGGGMSHYLACHAADVFAAVAPNSFDLLEENSPQCNPSRPISVLSTRGTADGIVMYNGGASNPPNGLNTTIHFLGAERTLNHWREKNECSNTRVESNGCTLYSECSNGVEVGLCTLNGGGHVQGDANTGWNFLKTHQLP